MKGVKLFLFISSLISLFTSITFAECNPSKVVVLVPGTLNSAVPGAPSSNPYERVYFSQAILDTVNKYACHSYVIKGLSWFGDFRANGEVVLNEIREWHQQHPELQSLPIDVIAHSAGGFYTLQAVSLNSAQDASLKFAKLHFISTPMNGLELANILTANSLIRRQMENIFNRHYTGLDVRGLWQLRSSEVQNFIQNLRLPNDVEVHTYAGVQSSPPRWDREFDSAFLPPVFQAFEFLMDGIGDGIVSFASALGTPALMSNTGEKFINLYPHPEVEFPLDHVEQVWDFRYLKFLGFRNTDYVKKEQLKFIEQLFKLDL